MQRLDERHCRVDCRQTKQENKQNNHIHNKIYAKIYVKNTQPLICCLVSFRAAQMKFSFMYSHKAIYIDQWEREHGCHCQAAKTIFCRSCRGKSSRAGRGRGGKAVTRITDT